jgi:tRNA A-37 threonylcarbamoyl transferase component Bud32
VQSKKALNDVWKYVFENLYELKEESVNIEERDVYIQDRLLNKIEKAIAEDESLKAIINEKKIKVNGIEYDNFYIVLEKIKSNPDAWRDIATYRRSPVAHGDLTIDNILINSNTDKPFIIDPSDDNQIRGPIIDLGRHTQSLAAGYEFMNDDEEPVSASIEGKIYAINYHDRRSAQYMQLHDYLVNTIMKKYFTPTEQRAALFHAGLLYGRMLAHRVVINPSNTLKYYAVCVMLLNRYYDQYK